MYLPPVDRTFGEEEWRPFVEAQRFGHLIAPGRDRRLPLVQPTQFVLAGDQILLHLAAGNPLLGAVEAKFKYGGNVDEAHRTEVIDRLEDRDGTGDRAAAAHARRRAGRRP